MKIYARKDRSVWRVWPNTWAGDQFEVMKQHDFDKLESLLKRLSFSIEILGDDEN